jgi:hypothetical protein
MSIFETGDAVFLSFLASNAPPDDHLKRFCQFPAFLASHFHRKRYGIEPMGCLFWGKPEQIRDATHSSHPGEMIYGVLRTAAP